MSAALFHRIKIVMFFMIISAPLIASWLNIGKLNAEENRQLSSFPIWQGDGAIENYRDNLQNYFKDHFGLKTYMVSLLNQINFYLFVESPSKKVSMGKDGFIFLNSHDNSQPNSLIMQICKSELDDLSLLGKIRAGVNGFLASMEVKKVKPLFVLIPTKSKVYAEKLPDYLAEECDYDRQTWIDLLVKKMVNKYIFYPLETFISWKKSFPVYFSKHFHWTGRTPVETARLILQAWEINPQQGSLNRSKRFVESDLSRHFKGVNIGNQLTHYELDKSITKCQKIDCLTGLSDYYTNGNVQIFSRQAQGGHRLLILSDSFGPALAKTMTLGFAEVVSIDLNALQQEEEAAFFEWIFDRVKPSHIIYIVHDGGFIWQALRLERNFGKYSDLISQ